MRRTASTLHLDYEAEHCTPDIDTDSPYTVPDIILQSIMAAGDKDYKVISIRALEEAVVVRCEGVVMLEVRFQEQVGKGFQGRIEMCTLLFRVSQKK